MLGSFTLNVYLPAQYGVDDGSPKGATCKSVEVKRPDSGEQLLELKSNFDMPLPTGKAIRVPGGASATAEVLSPSALPPCSHHSLCPA